MNEALSIWEIIALGGVVLLVLFWWGPGVKGALEQSKNAEKDWAAVLVPIAAVVGFVFLLILLV